MAGQSGSDRNRKPTPEELAEELDIPVGAAEFLLLGDDWKESIAKFARKVNAPPPDSDFADFTETMEVIFDLGKVAFKTLGWFGRFFK